MLANVCDAAGIGLAAGTSVRLSCVLGALRALRVIVELVKVSHKIFDGQVVSNCKFSSCFEE